MINFLSDPEHFYSQVRLASLNKSSLAKIALVQLKYANSLEKTSNWLMNAISSKVIWVKNLFTKFVDSFHSLTKSVFLSTPVISHLTLFFRKIAYKRLLSAMYDSWKIGMKDGKVTRIKRTSEGLKHYLVQKSNADFNRAYATSSGSFYMRDPFHEEYLMGFEGKSPEKLTEKAKAIVERDIGTRTLTEICKAAFDSMNVFNTIYQLVREFSGIEAYTGKNRVRHIEKGTKTTKSRTVGFTFTLKILLQGTLWAILTSTGWAVFALYGTLSLGLVGLFYYSSSEALFKKGQAMGEFSSLFKQKSLKKEYHKILEEKIPTKDIFIKDSLGVLQNPSLSELKDIKEEYND